MKVPFMKPNGFMSDLEQKKSFDRCFNYSTESKKTCSAEESKEILIKEFYKNKQCNINNLIKQSKAEMFSKST